MNKLAQQDKRYTPDEALLLTMETLRSTHPSPAALKMIEIIESEIQARSIKGEAPQKVRRRRRKRFGSSQ